MKLRKNSPLITVVTCILTISVLAPAGRAVVATQPQQILDLVPTDAWGFLLLPDVRQLSTKVDNYAKQVGATEVPNVLELFSSKLGADMSDGPAAIVVLNYQVYGQQPFLVIFSVTDYQQLTKALNAQPTESPGIMKVTLPDNQPGYISRSGRFVILAPAEMIIKAVLESKYTLGKSLTAAQRKAINNSDAFCRVSLQTIVPAIKPMLMMFGSAAAMMGGQGMAIPGMPMSPPPGQQGDNASSTQMQAMQSTVAMITALMDLLDQLGNLDLVANIEQDGLRFVCNFSFRPGSEYAQRVNAQKPSDKPLLTGLPSGKFLLATGCDWTTAQPTKFELAMLDAMPTADPAIKEEFKQLSIEKMKLSTGVKLIAGVSKKPAPGDGMIQVQMVISSTDAARFVEVNRKLIELQPSYPLNIPGQNAEMKVQYATAAEKLGDIAVDQVVVEVAPLIKAIASTTNDPGFAAFFQQLFTVADGKLIVRMAAVNKTTVCATIGGKLAGLKQIIDAIGAGSSTLATSPAVVAASTNLQKNRIGELYVDPGNVIPIITAIAAMSGEQVSLPMSGELTAGWPVLGIGISTEPDTLRLEHFLPNELILKIKSLATAMTSRPAPMTQPTTQPALSK